MTTTALELAKILLERIEIDPDTDLLLDPGVVGIVGDRMYAIDSVQPVNNDQNVILNLRFLY
jgi:hypothetical protein